MCWVKPEDAGDWWVQNTAWVIEQYKDGETEGIRFVCFDREPKLYARHAYGRVSCSSKDDLPNIHDSIWIPERIE